MPGGWIVCESDVKAPAARATISEDGTFVLGTYEPDDGAVAGKHRASITPAGPEGADPDRGRIRQVIDQRFTRLESSGLEFEVVEHGMDEVVLVVAPPQRGRRNDVQ